MTIAIRTRHEPRRLASILGLAILGLAAPLTLQSQSPDIGPSAYAPRDMAVLVTTNDLLFDIESYGTESYGGGIGLKIGRDSNYLRILLDLFLSTASTGFSTGLGMTYEHHLTPGPVSPYWGVTGFMGLAIDQDRVDILNWFNVTAVPLSAAGLFGVELFFTDNVSLFIEYALILELNIVHTESSVAGNPIHDTSADFEVNTGLGNQSKLGIAIYLPSSAMQRRVKKHARNSRI